MKSISLLLIIIVFYSCTASRKDIKSYYYVEPFKEQEIILTFNTDSSFRLEDLIGCNQFEYVGQYKKSGEYYIFESIKYKNLMSRNSIPFPLADGDTAWIINRERIFIHKQPFKLILKANVNLQQIRYKKLEAYYIDLLGKNGFIKTFGNGKGKNEAKKRLLDCVIPDFKP